MQGMQRIRNLGIVGPGAGATWCGVAAAVQAVQSLQESHQQQACSTCCVGVLCRKGFFCRTKATPPRSPASAFSIALALQQISRPA